jgi:hypothetical protein
MQLRFLGSDLCITADMVIGRGDNNGINVINNKLTRVRFMP